MESLLFALCALLLSVTVPIESLITGPTHGKLVVCYVGTWAVYRPGRGSFSIEHVDPNLCTHLVYSFAGLNTTQDSIRSLDPWQDLSEDYGKGGYERLVKLKDRYPHLKVTLAIGGWNEGSTNYSQMSADSARRKRFVQNAVEFIRKHNFDGLDLDWEFPAKRGGAPHDKQNFLLLVKELRAAFNKFNLLLTAAFGAGKDTIDIAYDVAGLSIYLDYIHMMCYDYHGSWDRKIGSNAPLNSLDTYNVKYTIDYMLKMGAPANKLVLGIPLYGRTFLLQDIWADAEEAPAFGLLAKETGFQGQFTRENGFMGYNEICLALSNKTSGFTSFWNEESQTPFIVSGDKFITYDNERSIREKIRFAMKQQLAGAMVWSLDTDDFQGDCPASSNKEYRNFPLMHSINDAIEEALIDIKHAKENEISREDNSLSSSASICLPVRFATSLLPFFPIAYKVLL